MDNINEEKRFGQILGLLKERIDELVVFNRESLLTLKEQGKDMWDDIKHQIYSGFPDEMDEIVEILQYSTNLEHSQKRQQEGVEDLEIYTQMYKTPYFGRFDFVPDNDGDKINVYLGIRTLEEDGEIYVFDWRTPIASMYYENELGKAGYTAPDGIISGEITLKRQYKIENSVLIYYFDTDLQIDDVILQNELSKPSADKLKVIVTTIQREQNKAIRYASGKNLLITGPAGCGKTSIGMHRLAYILYKQHGKITASDIMILSNSNLFLDYISGILPELGEKECVETSFYDILRENISKDYLIYDYYEQADSILSREDDFREEAIGIKYSEDFLLHLENEVLKKPRYFKDIMHWDTVIISKEHLRERYENDSAYSPEKRKERLKSYIEPYIRQYFYDNAKELKEKLESKAEIYEKPDLLLRSEMMKVSGQANRMIDEAMIPDFVSVYLDTLKAYTGDNEIYHKTAESIARKTLNYEDAVTLMYMKAIYGNIKVKAYKHILIDEAQDYAPIQHRIMNKIYPESRFTILADINQAVASSVNTTSQNVINEIYNTDNVNLSRSYRSTRPISDLALRLIKDKYETFNRDGEAVRFIKTADTNREILKIIADLKPSEKICIITRSISESILLYNALKNKTGIEIITDANAETKGNILVTSVLFTKGLEFDRVIIPGADESRYSGEEGEKLLYMMITRALHKLYLIYEKNLPECIS